MLIRNAHPNDARAIAAVHVAAWRTTYRGIIPDAYLAALSVADRERRWAASLADTSGRTCAFVAEDDGHIVGFADGGPRREGSPAYAGELYAIYLLASHQGRGLGRRLVAAVAAYLSALGMSSLLLWVLAENPACRFYESLGGIPVERKPITIGGVPLDEVAYAWTDTRALLASSNRK